MAKTSPAQYIRNKVNEIKALVYPSGHEHEGNIAFQRVGRSADIDGERIVSIPAFPACVLTQLGGELEHANGDIWTKRFGATIVHRSVWDPFTDEACEKLDESADLLIDALEEDQEDDGIICIYESEDTTIVSDSKANEFVFRTLIFEYTIDRE